MVHELDPTDATGSAANGRRNWTIGWVWVGLGLTGAGAGFVTLSAAASLVAQAYTGDVLGWVVAAVAGTLSAIIPLLLGNGIVKLVLARASEPPRAAIYATSVALVNVIYVALLHFTGPQPVQQLWHERGTWVFDALTGQGPYGPAAVPLVTRALDDLAVSRGLAASNPLWCDADAAAFAVGLAAGLAKDGPAPFATQLRAVAERYGASLDALPADEVAGRALMGAVSDVVLATFPNLDLVSVSTPEPIIDHVERRRIRLLSPGWEARYEDGSWRWCRGNPQEARVRGLSHATALREEVRRVPTPNAVAAGPWDGEVRGALQEAVLGRSAWLAGAEVALDRSWADVLTRAAAADQGERVRRWCLRLADEERTEQLEALAQRWNLPEKGGRLDKVTRGLLDAQGRQYLAEVVDLCKPVITQRVERERAQGLDIPAAQRRRWAEAEARTFASDARLAADGSTGVTVEIDGRVLRAMQEDGRWRIDWRE